MAGDDARNTAGAPARAGTRRLASALRPLRRTPLHPQWLLESATRDLQARLGQLPADATVLDVGCADQWPRLRLPPGSTYFGLDLPATGVDWYGTRAQIFGSADALPVADGSVDVVLLLDVLEHLEHGERAMAEIARVLRPGGVALVQVPFLYPVHDAPRDFRRLTRFGLAASGQRHGLLAAERQGWGAGLESAALIANLGIARACLSLWRRRSPLLLVPVLALMLVPVLNVVARLSAWLDREADFAPFSELVVLQRPRGDGTA